MEKNAFFFSQMAQLRHLAGTNGAMLTSIPWSHACPIHETFRSRHTILSQGRRQHYRYRQVHEWLDLTKDCPEEPRINLFHTPAPHNANSHVTSSSLKPESLETQPIHSHVSGKGEAVACDHMQIVGIFKEHLCIFQDSGTVKRQVY